MNTASFLTQQIKDYQRWLHRVLHGVSDDQWDVIPDVIDSNITWQVGHIILTTHFHSVVCTTGVQEKIMQQVPLREYAKTFSAPAKPADNVGKMNPKEMLQHFAFLTDEIIRTVEAIPDEEWTGPLYPSKFPNPVANTKYEAVSWSTQHAMWHIGQISLIKRVLTGKSVFDR